MSEAKQNDTTHARGVPAIISYGVNLPALLRGPVRRLSDSELVAAWAVQKSARDAAAAAGDRRELVESRIALRLAQQRITELAGAAVEQAEQHESRIADAEAWAKADRDRLARAQAQLREAERRIVGFEEEAAQAESALDEAKQEIAALQRRVAQLEKSAAKGTAKGRGRNGARAETTAVETTQHA